jgi:hypothetical protein
MTVIIKIILGVSFLLSSFNCKNNFPLSQNFKNDTLPTKAKRAKNIIWQNVKLNEFSNDTIWIFPYDYILIRNWEKLDFDTIVCIDTMYSIKGELFFIK